MSRPICLKCGSANIDDGRDHLLWVLGIILMAAALFSLLLCTMQCPTPDWDSYDPVSYDNIPSALSFAFGMLLTTRGLTRAEQLTCRNCGAVWTSPQKVRLPHRKGTPQ